MSGSAAAVSPVIRKRLHTLGVGAEFRLGNPRAGRAIRLGALEAKFQAGSPHLKFRSSVRACLKTWDEPAYRLRISDEPTTIIKIKDEPTFRLRISDEKCLC